MTARNTFLLVLGLMTLGLTGCGDEPATITGVVRLRDRPLTSGIVWLFTADGQKLQTAIGKEGTYQITGVPLGKVRFAIQAPSRVPPGLLNPGDKPPSGTLPAVPAGPEPDKVVIPKRYAQPEQSGLSLEVKPGKQTYNLDLEP